MAMFITTENSKLNNLLFLISALFIMIFVMNLFGFFVYYKLLERKTNKEKSQNKDNI